MAKMVYDEWYGELTFSLRAVIRKNNVSPYDYTELEHEFGEGNYSAIQAAIVERSTSGMYRNNVSLVAPILKGW
jgi:hypothetical protein